MSDNNEAAAAAKVSFFYPTVSKEETTIQYVGLCNFFLFCRANNDNNHGIIISIPPFVSTVRTYTRALCHAFACFSAIHLYSWAHCDVFTSTFICARIACMHCHASHADSQAFFHCARMQTAQQRTALAFIHKPSVENGSAMCLGMFFASRSIRYVTR